MISVIVPVYNVKDYLDRAVESIIAQTYQNLEIILVDDGSTDESGQRCEEWAQKDSRIKVIHKQNGGLSSARNAGLDIAKGDFVTFPDSDDFIDVNYCEIMRKEMEDPNVSLVCCGMVATDIEGNEEVYCSEKKLRLTKEEALEDIFSYRTNVRPSACNKLYRIDYFSKHRFNENVVQEDTECMPRLIDSGKDVVVVNDTFYHYIKRPGSITTLKKFNLKSYRFLECFKEYENMCRTKYPNLEGLFYYYEMRGTFGMLLSLIDSKDARKYWTKEMVLRFRILKYFIKARKYDINIKEHGHEMTAMAERCIMGIRLSRKLFHLPQ